MSLSAPGSIMPREKGAAPLDVVIAVMALLAALALGASLVAQRTALGWRSGLAGRLTVQIVPPATASAQDLARQADAALGLLRATPGIAHAEILSDEKTQALVAPWIGTGAALAELPLPRLIDATLVPGAALDTQNLAHALKQAAPDSELDDHSRWIARLSGLAQGITWSAYAILLLIAVATAAAVSFATRAGLEAHHDMVELLHQMGAKPGFIARAFERHYFLSTLGAALAGASLAAIFFALVGSLESAGIEAVPFLPPLGLKVPELAWLLLVPAVSGIIALATARLSVLAALRKIY